MRTIYLALSVLALLGCNASAENPDLKNGNPAKQSQDPFTPPPKEEKHELQLTDLFNEDGHIDKELPASAGWGCKVPKKDEDLAILDTDAGRIVLKFFPDRAPNHVKNFMELVKTKFYNGTKFHRVIPKFMIQGGDPNTKHGPADTWGQGGPGKSVKAEFNDIPHVRGVLSMARSSDPDSAGSQFFIMHARAESLDHQYSAFGEVIEGMDVVDKIVNAPRGEQDRPDKPVAIKSATLAKWPIELKK